MVGGPEKVGGDFSCINNLLVNLEGAPKEVGGYFQCNANKLLSLEGGTKEVGKHFDCSDNKLGSLEGCPQKLGGGFYCCVNNLVDFVGLENTNIGGGIYPIAINQLPAGKADNTIVSLMGLREEYYNKVQVLDVEAIKAREQDGSLDVMV